MTWIVIGESNGRIKLVSKSNVDGILPKGSFLTVESGTSKIMLRVDDSQQDEPFAPSPMIANMNLQALQQDQKCQNIIYANRVFTFSERTDGLSDFIKPLSLARKSTQDEVYSALKCSSKGAKVFIATVQYNENQRLTDDTGKFVTATLPDDFFFHQTLICGKTGSGKTVAMKYLAQHFVEEYDGAVLLINVKGDDLLYMDTPSKTTNSALLEEWKTIGKKPAGVENFTVYYPANVPLSQTKRVNEKVTQKITLSVAELEPEAFGGLLQGITDSAAQVLPSIFRYWQKKVANSDPNMTFTKFRQWFQSYEDQELRYPTLNERDEEEPIKVHRGTYESIRRNMMAASNFFDNKDALVLDETHILERGKMSVIDVSVPQGIQFGGILLRQLLHKIATAKSEKKSNVPVLIIIDEVHKFYDETSTQGALEDLNTICRTGRGDEIAVMFASQNLTDLPAGLQSVANTKILFRSDLPSAKIAGMNVTAQEMESLGNGFARVSIFGVSQLNMVKFPLSLSGVIEK